MLGPRATIGGCSRTEIALAGMFRLTDDGLRRTELQDVIPHRVALATDKSMVSSFKWKVLPTGAPLRIDGMKSDVGMIVYMRKTDATEEVLGDANAIAKEGRMFRLIACNGSGENTKCEGDQCHLDMSDGRVGELIENIITENVKPSGLSLKDIPIDQLKIVAREFVGEHIHNPQVEEWMTTFIATVENDLTVENDVTALDADISTLRSLRASLKFLATDPTCSAILGRSADMHATIEERVKKHLEALLAEQRDGADRMSDTLKLEHRKLVAELKAEFLGGETKDQPEIQLEAKDQLETTVPPKTD